MSQLWTQLLGWMLLRALVLGPVCLLYWLISRDIEGRPDKNQDLQ